MNKTLFSYLLLTVGYLAIAVSVGNRFFDIAAAGIVACMAFYIGRPNFIGSALALFASTFLSAYFILYFVVKSQGIAEPLTYIIKKTTATDWAYSLAPFIVGLIVLVICNMQSNHPLKRDEETAGVSE